MLLEKLENKIKFKPEIQLEDNMEFGYADFLYSR